jgi:uncharacterized membrane protein (DUF4010 family)
MAIATWIKPSITLAALGLLAWLAPIAPIDPWSLLSPRNIATMILALAMIQAFGSSLAHCLGTRTGAILTGFLGGLVSSTATTASLARRSKLSSQSDSSSEILTFLSATGAMLIEGLALVITGTKNLHFSILLIFIGPILATLGLIFVQYRTLEDRSGSSEPSTFELLPILKLSAFIVAILAVSKICQNLFGQNGLLAVTSLVSLFEIHGSVIANIQLHESGDVTINFLCSLLAVSIVASYLSKLFLISTLGSPSLRSYAIKRTLFLFCTLAMSWAAAVGLS